MIPGYKLYRKDRERKVGGGIASYIKDSTKSNRLENIWGTNFPTSVMDGKTGP